MPIKEGGGLVERTPSTLLEVQISKRVMGAGSEEVGVRVKREKLWRYVFVPDSLVFSVATI
jgi:hypothetical protein